MKRTRMLLLFAILLAFGLRLYRAGAQELWGDEAAKLEVVMRDVAHLFSLGAEVHPRFMHVWLFVWHKIFGFNEFGLRTLPVFFSTLTVPVVAMLATRLAGRWQAGACAALLLAVAPFHIYYAQDITQYALLGLMIAAAWLLLWHAVRGGRWHWLGYGICVVLALHTHYYAAFAVLAQATWLMFVIARAVNKRALFTRFIGSAAFAAVLVLPWALPHISMFAGQLNTSPPPFGLGQWLSVLGGIFEKFVVGPSCTWLCAPLAGLHWLLFAVALVTGVLQARAAAKHGQHMGHACGQSTNVDFPLAARDLGPRDPQHAPNQIAISRQAQNVPTSTGITRSAMLALGALLPIVLVSLASFRMTWFNERFATAALPMAFAGMGVGLAALGDVTFSKSHASTWLAPLSRPIFFAALLISSATSLNALYFDSAHLKSQYGAMLKFIAARAQPGDVLLLNGPQQKTLFEIYQTGMPAKFIEPGPLLREDSAQASLTALTQDSSRAWLVMTGPPESYDPQKRAELALAKQGYKAFYRSFPGAGAYVTLYAFKRDGLQTFAETRASFGAGMRLTGVAVEPAEAQPGGTLFLTLRWEASAPINTNYTVFTHLLSPDGMLLDQADGEPLNGARPTNTWQPGEVILDNYALNLPEDAGPGAYTVQIGFYDWRTGQRVLAGNLDVIRVATVQVR